MISEFNPLRKAIQYDSRRSAHRNITKYRQFVSLSFFWFIFLMHTALLRAQTLTPEYTLFAVRTTAPAQVTVEKNGSSASAHTADNGVATLKLDNPLFDMSGSTVRVGSVYPNPSSGAVSVDFSVPRPMTVQISFFDVLGRLVNASQSRALSEAGVYRLDPGMSKIAGGIYFLRLAYPGRTVIRKFTILGRGIDRPPALTFLGKFDFNPAENRYCPPRDPSGLDTAAVRIVPDDTGTYVSLDTVVVYQQPAAGPDTVRLFLPLKKMDVVTYLLRAFLNNGPEAPNKAFNGHIELPDGTQLPIHGRYDRQIINAQHIGVDAKSNRYARVVIAPADSTQGIDANVTGLPAGPEKDLGSFGINWKDFPPEFLATFTDTVNAENGFANMHRDSTARDFNNDINNMLVANLPNGQIQQAYNKETGELSVNLNGYDQNFDAVLRVTDRAGNTISAPVHFNVTPDTAQYRFTAELTNGPEGKMQYHGSMVFSSGDTASFTGEFNKPIIVARYNKNMPSVEDYIIRSIFATDSTQATQDTLRMIANADTADLDRMLVKWQNYSPEFAAQPSDIDTLEDRAGKTAFKARDFNGGPLSYGLNGLPPGWSYEVIDNKLIIQPPENWSGTLEGLTLTVSDGEYTRTSDPFRAAWQPVNDAPATNVPDQSVPRGGQIVIDLNQYVNDPDNSPSEMTWKAADYDTNLVKILIDTLNHATIKSRGENGSTPIVWVATDPDSAAGRNDANIRIDPAYLLTVRLQDPIDDALWKNVPFDLITYTYPKHHSQAIIDTIHLITNNNGEASLYTKADSGRVIVPLSDSLYETTQRFRGLKGDAGLVVPVVHRDYPLSNFGQIQSPTPGNDWDAVAWVTTWDPAVFNKGKNGEPDTLRMLYYEKSPQDNMIPVLRDSIISWNEKYFRRMTPNWVLEPPKTGHNVIFYYPESIADEGAKEGEIIDADTLPNNAGMGWLISHYGITPSSGGNDVFNNPSGPFYATRGHIVTPFLYTPRGAHFEESGTALQLSNGEIQTGEWPYTIYGGGSAWPPFTSRGTYKGREYVLEVLIGRAHFGLAPGTEVRPTRIMPPAKDLSP